MITPLLLRSRWYLFTLVLGAVGVMGFYAITDGSYLQHDHVLTGADWAGYGVCHRISERSFTINGRQFPLCARCTGMYLGVALTFSLFWLSGRSRRSDLPPRGILLIFLGLIGLMGIDGLNSYSHFFPNAPHLYEPRNWLRLLTGMGTGLAMGVIIFPALVQTLWREQEYEPSVANWRELLGIIVVGGTAVLLILSNQPHILYVLAIMSAIGLIAIITALNSIIVLTITRREAQAQNWQQASLPLFIGLTLTILELSAIGLLRFNLTGTLTGIPGL